MTSLVKIAYSAWAKNPGLTQTFYPTNSLLSSFSSSYYNPLILPASFFSLYTYACAFYSVEMHIIRPAEYKLPIIREICICIFSLYTKMEFIIIILFQLSISLLSFCMLCTDIIALILSPLLPFYSSCLCYHHYRWEAASRHQALGTNGPERS